MAEVRQRETVTVRTTRRETREEQDQDLPVQQQQTKKQVQAKAQDLQHQAEALLHQGEVKAHQLANNLQANPKLATGLLVLIAFCLGIAVSSIAARSGLMGGAKFNDPQSRQAHEALDTMLGHVHGLKGSVGDKVEYAQEQLKNVKDASYDKLGAKGKAAVNAAQAAVEHTNLGERLQDGYNKVMGHADALKDQAKVQADAVNARLNGAGATTSLGERVVDGLGNLKDRVMGTHEPTLAEKAQDMLNNGIQGVKDAVKPHEPTLSEKLAAGVAGLKAKVAPHEPTLAEKAQEMLNNGIQGVKDAVKPHEPTLSEKLSNGYQAVKDSLSPKEPSLVEKAQAHATDLKNKVTGQAPTANTVQGKLNEASLKAKNALHNAADAIKNNIPGMGGAADAVKAHVH